MTGLQLVPCPKCGEMLSVKIKPKTHTLDWAKGQVVVVLFMTQTIRHTCKESS